MGRGHAGGDGFLQGLSHAAAAAIKLLRSGFGGSVVGDRCSAYKHLPRQWRQRYWAHGMRDLLVAIAERPGTSGEFGLNNWACRSSGLPTGTEQTPWAKTARTCRHLLAVADGL